MSTVKMALIRLENIKQNPSWPEYGLLIFKNKVYLQRLPVNRKIFEMLCYLI
jgi:hypothetical protein